jgi:hypothetical protein
VRTLANFNLCNYDALGSLGTMLMLQDTDFRQGEALANGSGEAFTVRSEDLVPMHNGLLLLKSRVPSYLASHDRWQYVEKSEKKQ